MSRQEMMEQDIDAVVYELERLGFKEMSPLENQMSIGKSPRRRFNYNSLRVTVGGRTTCVYEVEDGMSINMENLKTDDLDIIVDEIERRLNA